MSKRLLAFQAFMIALLFAILLALGPASAQPAHQHPPRDALVHEQFYLNWDRPDFPGNNCCKLSDCYAAPIKLIGASHYALIRTIVRDPNTGLNTNEYTLNDPKEPANWVLIPPERLEQNQMPGHTAHSNASHEDYVMREPLDSPDGRSHVCMIEVLGDAMMMSTDAWFVLCAVLGAEG